MEKLLEACKALFDRSPQPFGVAHVYVDENGAPVDFSYAYLNASMAAMTGQTVDDLRDQCVYAMWGGDRTWLEHFYEAAYHEAVVEFESATELLEEFLHVSVFPVAPEYCGFFLQDVTNWISPAHLSMEQVSAGLFFYDMRNRRVLLTPSAQEIGGLMSSYTSVSDFTEKVFGVTDEEVVNGFLAADCGREEVVTHEGQLADGRWLRMSVGHAGKTDQFAFGFLEDITRTRDAEERSARYFDIIDSLSRENFALYLVDLEEDRIEPYRLDTSGEGALEGVVRQHSSYREAMGIYVQTFVVPQDRARVAAEVDLQAVKRHFDEGVDDFSLNYLRVFEGDEQFVELRIIRLHGTDSKMVLAARNTTDEMHEQLRQKEALQNALELARHASAAKSTFLTNMSHDFRTPMNSISGFANIALDHLDDIDRVRDCLRKITLSSEHLLNLVNDILDVSRIESGKLSLAEELVDMEEVARNIEIVFSEKARASGLDYTVETGHLAHPRVLADPLRLNQILMNTVGNAIKFTGQGGLVSVGLSEGSKAPTGYGSFVFTIRDTGCGMSPEFLDRLFEPFERDGLGYVNKTEGTGLGMTITKNLVDLMGGSIEVESAVGRGTMLTITLPLRLAEEPGHDADDDADDERDVLRRDFSGCRVLVVDDDDLSREILVEILKDHGFVLEEARDGDAAVRKVAASEPFYYDAVLMDMRMPRLDGDEATREIRALDRPDAATLPIIAETADAFEEGKRRAREAGMTALTTKPLNIRTLIGILAEHVPEK